LSRTESVTLLIVHEASAFPYLFYKYAIERAAAGLEASVRPDLA